MTTVLYKRKHYNEAEYHLLPADVQERLVKLGTMRAPKPAEPETNLFPDGFPHAAILQAAGLNYASVPQTEAELLQIDGIGPAKAREIAAWFEQGK